MVLFLEFILMNLLFSWIGDNDLKDIVKTSEFGALYSICTSNIATFDKLVLLSNRNNDKIQEYLYWLHSNLSPKKIIVEFELFDKYPDPTDYHMIYKICEQTIKKHRTSKDSLYFNLTSGTPTMSATWLLLGTSIFKAILIQSSKQKGVEIINVPYEISLQERQDNTLTKLSGDILLDEFNAKNNTDNNMQKISHFVQLFAPRNIPIIIQGETGTGKEKLAKEIHELSNRKDKPFIAINCGAINENLIDSELFGHKKGSFTGADKDRDGHFKSANCGTLFLDEIGELSLSSQVKLLRVLQEQEITPVGSSKPIKIDVRIVCATHRNLLKMIQNGEFREDLYYRLAVGMIEIPALRNRGRENIINLSQKLLQEINHQFFGDDFCIKKFSPCALQFITAQYWLGNIRELQNTLLRVCVYYPYEKILTRDHISSMIINPDIPIPKNQINIEIPVNAPEKIKEIKKIYAEQALKMANYRKNKAGEMLNISSQVLDNWRDCK